MLFSVCAQELYLGIYTSMADGRKILFFLGAGASVGAGAYATVQAGGRIQIPVQSDFWSVFLRFIKGRANRKIIESFLFRYFLGYNESPLLMVNAENLNFLENDEHFNLLLEEISRISSGRHYFNPII